MHGCEPCPSDLSKVRATKRPSESRVVICGAGCGIPRIYAASQFTQPADVVVRQQDGRLPSPALSTTASRRVMEFFATDWPSPALPHGVLALRGAVVHGRPSGLDGIAETERELR